jgi:hypothetical protein
MTRDELALWLGNRFDRYLTTVVREATDTPGNLEAVINDTLRALGVAYADLSTAVASTDTQIDDWTVQGSYRAMLQFKRDLGGTVFDVATGGDSFKLSQLRISAEKDLEDTKAAVLERFDTLGPVTASDASSVWVMDFNYLVPDEVLA